MASTHEWMQEMTIWGEWALSLSFPPLLPLTPFLHLSPPTSIALPIPTIHHSSLPPPSVTLPYPHHPLLPIPPPSPLHHFPIPSSLSTTPSPPPFNFECSKINLCSSSQYPLVFPVQILVDSNLSIFYTSPYLNWNLFHMDSTLRCYGISMELWRHDVKFDKCGLMIPWTYAICHSMDSI